LWISRSPVHRQGRCLEEASSGSIVELEECDMSLHVHRMAITAERNLLPTQAMRGWQIEEAVAANKCDATNSGHQAGLPSVSALGRVGHLLLAAFALLRPLSV
jgi:hypothetical protein